MWILLALGIWSQTATVRPLIYIDKFRDRISCEKAAQLYRPDCHVNPEVPCGNQPVFCVQARIQIVPGAE